MGGALLGGWLSSGFDLDQITVITPHPNNNFGVRVNPSIPYPVDIIVLAVKPQKLAEAIPQIHPFIHKDTVFLSIAAGKTIAWLQAHLPPNSAVVRAMPNTPCEIGKGVTSMVAAPNVAPQAVARCQALMQAVGEVIILSDEALIDAATAVAGSGPAYVFYFVECLTQAGVQRGLAPADAARLARGTVIGSGALLNDCDLSPSLLRQNVTSPNGVTAAALIPLMASDGLGKLMQDVIDAAINKNQEMAKE